MRAGGVGCQFPGVGPPASLSFVERQQRMENMNVTNRLVLCLNVVLLSLSPALLVGRLVPGLALDW